MASKAKSAFSKSPLRWPWSKKRNVDRTVGEQPEDRPEVPTNPVIDALNPGSRGTNVGRIQSIPIGSEPTAPQIDAALNTATPSGSEERQLKHSTSKEPGSCPSGLEIAQATVSSAGASSSFFTNASNLVVKTLQINAHQHESSSNDAGWERLLRNAAPNALHDSECRFNPPKCDEDTRVEAIGELMGWIQDRESPQRLLCMTGAAGSGKSALQQTVAEECSGKDILVATFFFSSTDPTRNTMSAVIPTIAYQLGSNNPTLREAISAAVTKDPLIFKKSLKTQMKTLVISPFENLSRAISKAELAALPYAILIDGLDECTDEQRQVELLETIDDCFLQKDALPFRIFISSRPEWAIRSALEVTGYLHHKTYHIQLSDQYDASGDIRRSLSRRLRELGRRSDDPRAQSSSWPSEEDIVTLVVNASGQFIYAATVIKFVSERRSSPVDRLRAVLNWTPEDRAQPFAALDLLYTNIVSAAKEAYEAAHPERDFLLLLRVYELLGNGSWPSYVSFAAAEVNELLDLGDNAHRWLISDLRSLVTTVDSVQATPPSPLEDLNFYHKSFVDFLDGASRSKSLFVPESRVFEFVTASCIQALDRDDSSAASVSGLICHFLLRPLGYPGFTSPHLEAISHRLPEATKRWEKVEQCVWEDSKRFQSADPWNFASFFKPVFDGWLAFLSHALLEYENCDQIAVDVGINESKAWNPPAFLQPPPVFAARMASKANSASSKSSLRWPWSKKKRNVDRIVGQPEDRLEVPPTQPVIDALERKTNIGPIQSIPIGPAPIAPPIGVASNTATPWSSEERQLEHPTSSGLEIAQATVSSAGPPSSFFTNASNLVVKNLQINAHQHESNSNDAGWERLLQNTAPNALHDSECRFDPPKCDEDTRVEVIGELMGWIQDRESPQRLLCMTGAAGSGKSALQQTISGECSGKDILASTFFFSSTDPTRNTVSAVIPTIAYQLGSNNPPLREAISAAVTKDPLIFKKSLKTQMKTLVISPFENLSRAISKAELAALPYAILIDGLDECTDEQRQAELLATIDDCFLQKDALPFRIFISSRPEWAIRSALEVTGYLHYKTYHIQLSDQYDASGDIRRSLSRRLRELGRRSGDPRAQSPSWPSEEDIETLVANASGQFIYAATVIKFVSERRSSPVDRLRAVITWTPEDRAQPFAALDLLYTNIVSAAKEAYEAAHPEQDFLLLLRIYELLGRGRCTVTRFAPITVNQLLDLEDSTHRWLISDLRSLVRVTTVDHQGKAISPWPVELLEFYHKSFIDFLDSAIRSNSLFVPESRAFEFVTESCLRALDRNDSSASYSLNVFICYFLVGSLGDDWSGSPLFEAISHRLPKATKRWEKVEKCVSEESERYQLANPVLFPTLFRQVFDGWLAYLSHALLEYENLDQETYRRIQASYDSRRLLA
ncbi:hypothetical protein EST38_g2265 [Candolleomyces aberdarensis]|uniref:Nephrocystin 3-like N-terminal domain-containing protein n=1 Tax=Candolleomyces aberdarensis TaxID=2316362 RepID=A0A4Q2DVZ5_9AGAR|nr:hypothetical protein EST38_g2265 [Candolleomyces aberdarensis]